MSTRYKIKPAGSNWGEFGDDDQIGRLNYITKEKVLQGVAEVKEGKSFCLSLPLNRPGTAALATTRRPPKVLPAIVGRKKVPFMNFPMSRVTPGSRDIVSDDFAVLYLQHSTQWDGFPHHGHLYDAQGNGQEEIYYYNGFKGGTDIVVIEDYEENGPTHGGALKLGIEKFAESCVQGRGVLIDIEKHFGRERRSVTYADIASIMEKDKIIVEKGDMVLFRTGLAQLVLEGGDHPDSALLNSSCAGLNGDDPQLLQWIRDSGLSAIAMDNFAVELMVIGEERHLDHDCSTSPVHSLCLFQLGIPLGELWYLTELADWLSANNRSRFLLTAPPLRLPGAVGSPLTPIATV